jgi:alanyl-tRNA synthetase
MTERLYYTDAALRAFEATVIACAEVDGRAQVVLDRTAFYPTSGGQPFDLGRLGGAEVIEVVDRDDGEVVHVVSEPVAVGERVRGEIDWPRRLDHMQQHTGQHILSAAFDRLFGVQTVSFHMGAAESTIDLAREVISEETAAAEAESNLVVWEDRPVAVRFVSAEEAARLPLRKPPARTGTLRLVEVPDFDLSACGGTHVPRTGVVGVIAISAQERFKGGSRIMFVCGGRALQSHRALRDVVADATRAISVTPPELGAAIRRLQQEAKDRDRERRGLLEALAGYRAIEARAAAERVGDRRVVFIVEPGWDAASLKTLASRVTAEPGYVAAVAGSGSPLPIVIARSADESIDAAALVRDITARFTGRGGGRPDLAQAGVTATAAEIFDTIRAALS